MAHELEFDATGARFVYRTGNTPWHGLGTEIPDQMDIPRALELARLANWDLRKEPVYVRDEARSTFRRVRDQVAVYRHQDGRALGVVGDGYEVFSNEETFLGLGGALGQLGLPVKTAGSLRQGSQVFMCFEHPESAHLPNGDEIKGHLLISTSHDGSLALSAADVALVVVCKNTLDMALGGRKSIFTIRHTRNMRESVEEARRLLRAADEARSLKLRAAEALCNRQVTPQAAKAFWETLVPLDPALPSEDRRVRNALDLRETLERIYQEHPTQANKIGTAWGLYNAVTFYSNHLQTRRSTSAASAAENRMAALTGGRDELGARALKLLAVN